MHRVVVLALDGVYPFELGVPQRVFGSADGRYEVLTCSVDGGPVRSEADFAIAVEHGPELLRTADTVVIPPYDMSLLVAELPQPVADALALIRPGTRIVSICTGAFALAAAGMLDGRLATTHWRLTDLFRRLFPAVRLDPDVLFVDDGDVLTSAGAASGVDVCLHVVRNDHGSEVANQVARTCVVPAWREGGQAQYIERPVPDPAESSTAATRTWALANLQLPLSLADLAEHARMSGRTFARRFRDEVGVSPGRWLTQQRVARARHLLESSDLPIDEIAAQVGFATAASLRQHLNAAIGVAPLAYRRTFRAGV
ncbi:Transcriptional regulator GlxA family, contains an amidase domain and an AraC-type DNA-binding HTH domain [Saccharopolyspora antimicrobica]|uniref:AraC family transcriptional regulator with amidase-like domain n=1 Tax=Saccharopolyspora antimicrobica TaxID=455193 RepID=A0A1I4TEB6_9PSEU|nr:helix-turn-helix domain-containing protein [Saccharopolyspora antimicrobica]RKT85748.1 AraC family transcriptional regulator with amidase-like domain [Saccharopolyspora antimicrobica]SFM75118.1 Transcriptional regulator GlxA family, contains an amidase domain and an AraC-type DNA-binding HTH domain [Saccharopolyspora antimicrobica]